MADLTNGGGPHLWWQTSLTVTDLTTSHLEVKDLIQKANNKSFTEYRHDEDLREYLKKLVNKMDENDRVDDIRDSWQLIAKIIDRCLLILFFLFLVGLLIYTLCMSMNKQIF